MSEKCEVRKCDRPRMEEQPYPPPEAQLCQHHHDRLMRAIEEQDVATIVSIGASVCLTRDFPSDSETEPEPSP